MALPVGGRVSAEETCRISIESTKVLPFLVDRARVAECGTWSSCARITRNTAVSVGFRRRSTPNQWGTDSPAGLRPGIGNRGVRNLIEYTPVWVSPNGNVLRLQGAGSVPC